MQEGRKKFNPAKNTGLDALKYLAALKNGVTTAQWLKISGDEDVPDPAGEEWRIDSYRDNIKELGEKFITTKTLTKEEKSNLSIYERLLAGELAEQKQAKEDLLEYNAAAEAGLQWHQDNGGDVIQTARNRFADSATRMIQLRKLNAEITSTYLGIPRDVREILDNQMLAREEENSTSGALALFQHLDDDHTLMKMHYKANAAAAVAEELAPVMTVPVLINLFKSKLKIGHLTSATDARLINNLLNYIDDGPANTWEGLKAKVIRAAQQGDATPQESGQAHKIGSAQQGHQHEMARRQFGEESYQANVANSFHSGAESAGAGGEPRQHLWSQGRGNTGRGGDFSHRGGREFSKPSVLNDPHYKVGCCLTWRKLKLGVSTEQCTHDPCMFIHEKHVVDESNDRAAKKPRGDDGEN